jgi:hypothetical protein
VAVAEALTVNKTLRKIVLSPLLDTEGLGRQVQDADGDALSAPASYEIFCSMLRVNTSLVPFSSFLRSTMLSAMKGLSRFSQPDVY